MVGITYIVQVTHVFRYASFCVYIKTDTYNNLIQEYAMTPSLDQPLDSSESTHQNDTQHDTGEFRVPGPPYEDRVTNKNQQVSTSDAPPPAPPRGPF